MLRPLFIFLSILCFHRAGVAENSAKSKQALAQLVEQRLQTTAGDVNHNPDWDWTPQSRFSHFVPIQYFEFRLNHSELDRNWYPDKYNHGLGRSSLYADSYELRLHLKSYGEFLKSGESSRLSIDLLDMARFNKRNEDAYTTYRDITHQVLLRRLQVHYQTQLKAGSRGERASDRNAELLKLPKYNVRELVRSLERQGFSETEIKALSAQVSPGFEFTKEQVLLWSESLIDQIQGLAKQVADLKNPSSIENRQREQEIKLERINRELKWSEDQKWFQHIDLSRDIYKGEYSITLAFTVPLVRFDGEVRRREQALMIAKEMDFEREKRASALDIDLKFQEVLSLAGRVLSLRERLEKAKSVLTRTNSIRDIDLKSVLNDMRFEVEQDLLLSSIKYFDTYLEFLRDTGSFATNSSRNLLDGNWESWTEKAK